jgi:hypothetical protein
MYDVNRTAQAAHYAIPARLNGRDCDVIVSFGADNPNGRILGVRNEFGFIIQKGFEEIETGDKLAFYYQVPEKEYGDKWVLDNEFTVEQNLALEWKAADAGTRLGLILTDMLNNRRFVAPDEADINADVMSLS